MQIYAKGSTKVGLENRAFTNLVMIIGSACLLLGAWRLLQMTLELVSK